MKVRDIIGRYVDSKLLERLVELKNKMHDEGLDTNEFREYAEATRRFTFKIIGVLEICVEQDEKGQEEKE